MTQEAIDRLHILTWQEHLTPEEVEEKRQLDNQRDREFRVLMQNVNQRNGRENPQS